MPKCLLDACHEYYDENDHLSRFINDRCEIFPEFNINAGIFRNSYNNSTKSNNSQEHLKRMMEKREFIYGKPLVDGKQVKSYIGLS